MEPLRHSCAGIVITGDLNAPPGEATHTAFTKAGYASASQVGLGFGRGDGGFGCVCVCVGGRGCLFWSLPLILAPPFSKHQTPTQHPHPIHTTQVANGREPPVTWPSGLVAPLMDEGEPHCADYVLVCESPSYDMRVTAARVAGDAPAAGDPTLYPSDHFGLHVRLSVRRSGGGRGSRKGSGG